MCQQVLNHPSNMGTNCAFGLLFSNPIAVGIGIGIAIGIDIDTSNPDPDSFENRNLWPCEVYKITDCARLRYSRTSAFFRIFWTAFAILRTAVVAHINRRGTSARRWLFSKQYQPNQSIYGQACQKQKENIQHGITSYRAHCSQRILYGMGEAGRDPLLSRRVRITVLNQIPQCALQLRKLKGKSGV